MANGIEGRHGIYGTFSAWLQEAKVSEKEFDRNGDGKIEDKEIAAYVLSHYDKFSQKIQKQIDVLQKAFRALGFGDEEAKTLLTGEAKVGAKRLVEKGEEFENRAQQLKGRDNGNKKTYRELLGNAEQAYRLALDLDPADAQAQRHLSDLQYRSGKPKEGREHAVLALRNTPLKEVPELIRWLQSLPDPGIKKTPAIHLVGAEWAKAGRYDDARELFDGMARNLAKDGEEAKARKYREKAMLVDEMGKPYRLEFDAKKNPEAAKLYEALRAEGIPTGLMAAALPGTAGSERRLSAAQVLAFVDKNGADPRVQKVLKEWGLEPPKLKFRNAAEREAYDKLSFSQKHSLYHQRQAEAARDAKTKGKHLAAAAHFDPNSAEKQRTLGEFHLGRKNHAAAVEAYENLIRIDPANAADRQALADLHLAEGRWDLAYQVLPSDKAEILMIDRLGKAEQFAKAGEYQKGEALVQTARTLLEESYKNRKALPADEAGRVLRLKGRMDLVAGEIHSRKTAPKDAVLDYTQAVGSATEAIQKNPKDAEALLIRAKGFEKLGNLSGAMADYQAAAALRPGVAHSAEYKEFVTGYRKHLRSEFQKEMDNLRRFTYEEGEVEKEKAAASLANLETMAATLKSLPSLTDTQSFVDKMLVREFFQLRVQSIEALGTMTFVGVLPKETDPNATGAVSVAQKATEALLGPSGLGSIVKPVTDYVEKVEEDAKRREEHQEHLVSINYAARKGAYEGELKALEAEMLDLRDKLLDNLEPKDKCADPRAQLVKIRTVIEIDMELGLLDYDHIVRDYEAWNRILESAGPGLSSDPVFFFENWQATYDLVLKTPSNKVAGGVFEPQDAILKRLKATLGDKEFQKNLRAEYEKAGGQHWDQAAFDQLVRQFNEGHDVTKLKLLTPYISPEGLKTFFTKNAQAKALETEFNKHLLTGDPSDFGKGHPYGIQALKLYAETGNAPMVEELIERMGSHGRMSLSGRELSDKQYTMELLQMKREMVLALRGTDLRPKKDGDTFENMVLNDARMHARSLMNDSFVHTSEDIQGLVAARAFFESDRDSESVQDIDRKMKEGQKYLEEAVMSRVNLFESATEREMRSYGSEFSLYKPEERRQTLLEAAALVEADLALMGTKDLSKPEVKKEVARQLLAHTDLWRRGLEANQDLPLEFRIEQYRKLAATVALFNANFTTGDDPMMHKVEPVVSDEVKNTRAWQHDQAGAPPTLETQTKAINKMGKALIEENPYAFYPQLTDNVQYIVQTSQEHRLPKRIQDGVVGYYMKRSEDAARMGVKIEDSHYKAITPQEWQEIDKIIATTSYDASTQETLLKQYLIQIGKFEPIAGSAATMAANIKADYQFRFEQAMQTGDVDFISVMGTKSFQAFAQVDMQAQQKLAESRNNDLPVQKRFEAGMEAAAMFGQLGLEARADEALAPIVKDVEENPNLQQRATDYLALAQVYEGSGMDAKAKVYLQKIVDLGAKQASGETAPDKGLQEISVFAQAKIQLIDGNLDEAKKLLTDIQGNPLAAQYLKTIDGVQFQQRVGYPMEFLSGILMAEVDKRRGTNRDSLEYLQKKGEVDEFMYASQAFLTEAQRLCESGECKSLQEAMDILTQDKRYSAVFAFLESTGRGKDTLAYIKTMSNPALTDMQMAGATLELATKLLNRDDFDFAMNIAAGLMDDPFVSKQAKLLVKTTIPDAAKAKARNDAIWKAVKDILIVPAIIEGRYGDAFVSAVTTIASFGVGRIFSAGAKIGWAAATARGVARAGWAARVAGSAGFRVAGFAFVAMADNAGFAIGSMLMESAVTGKNQFSMDRFWHEMLVGIAPFALVHGSGKLMSVIGKRAEHIPWLKVANQAEANLLKSQGKFAVSQAGRVGLWTGHRLMNASAFTLGGLINKKTGLLEDDNAPLGLMFLQNLAMDLQMLAAHKGVNALTGGRMDVHDRQLDQQMYLAASMGKLNINTKHPASKAMYELLPHYADALAQKRGKPLSSNELAREVGSLNDGILEVLKIGGLTKGNGFETARVQLFLHAAKENISGKDLKEFAQRVGEIPDFGRVASELLTKDFSKSDREALDGHLLLWAMALSKDPEGAKNKLEGMVKLAPEIGKNLDGAIDGILGPGGSQTVAGKRLREAFLGRALEAGKDPAQVLALVEDAARLGPKLGTSMDGLLAANNISDPAAKLHLVEWMMEKGFDLASFNYLSKEVRNGEVLLKFEEGKLFTERVPADQQAKQKEAVAQNEAAHREARRKAELAKVVDFLGLFQTFSGKADKDRYQAMLDGALTKGKVAPEQAKELFLGIKPNLAKHVEPMQLEAVSNAVFIKILSGELSADKVWDLSARLAKGEILLEVGAFGEYREVNPEARSLSKDEPQVLRPLPRAPDDSPTVVKPRPKDSPTPDGGGEGTQVGSGRARRKPAAGDDRAAAYSGDTRVAAKPGPKPEAEALAWKPGADGGSEAPLGSGVLRADKQGALTLEFPQAKDPVTLRHNGRELRLESDDILQIRAGDVIEIDGLRYVRSGNELRPFAQPSPGKVLADGGNGKIFDNGDGSVTKQGKTRKVMTADGTVREIDPATAFDNEQRALAFLQDMAAREPALADFAPALIARTGAGEMVIGKVPGKTLENLSVAERKAIPEQAWKDFETALKRLGEAGLYHGDMNPQNVLWDGTKLRLIDFGNAQFKVADNNDLKRFQEMKADAQSDRADFPIRAHAVAKGNLAIPDPAFKPSEPAPAREAEVLPLRPVDGDGTKVVGKGRKGQKSAPPAETGDGYFEAAAFSGDPRGPIHSDPGMPQGSKGEEKTRKADEGPRVGLLLSADGLDGFSVRADQEKTLRWSSRDGKIPGEPWTVDIKPQGDGTFLLVPVEGKIRYHDGASYVEVPKKGLTLKSDRDLRLQLGDLDFQWRKPGAETGKSLVTGSRQAGEFLVGEIFDYYHGADTQKTLLVFTKRQDAWGEAARAFEKDLGRLEGLDKEYHGLIEAYRKDPTLEGRKELNRKWEAIEELSKQLHTSRYHRMETQHAWTMRAREAELFPLEAFLGMAEFHALDAARNRPDGKSDFGYQIRYAKPEELAGFEGAWSQVPFDKFVGVEAVVKDWETAQKLVGEMKQNGELHVVSDFSLSPDGKTGRAVVEIWGERPRRVEIRFSLRDAAAGEPKVSLPPYEGRDISDLKPGDLLVRDGSGVRPLEFSKKFSQTIRLPQGDLLLKWDPAAETHSAIWFGKEPLRIQGADGTVRTLEPSRHGRKAKTETLRGDEILAAGKSEVRLVTQKAAAEDALQRAQIQDEVRTLEALRLSIEEMKAAREDPAKIADYEKMLVEAEAVFAKSLRQRRRTAEGVPYAEATNAQIGTANLPEGAGVAGFKSISDIEAKADKIAKAAPDPARIARYVEHLVHKKGMSRPDAEIQAQRWAEQVIVDARAHQAGRTHIYDTSLPLKPETAHMDPATVDHHGRFANPLNSTEQLLGKMEAVLDTVKSDPQALAEAAKDPQAMAAARRGLVDAGVKNPTDAQIREIAAAIRDLNLKEVTTDNLADGAWPVWIAKNQARIFADPALRKLVLEATHFEDFTAFGTTYNEKDPGVRLQAALFQEYGRILFENKIIGTDRFIDEHSDKSEQVMGEALAAIDKMVYNEGAREAAATEFFQKVESGSKVATEQAVIADSSVHQGDIDLTFFDLTKLGAYSLFQQWLALPRVEASGGPHSLQVSVIPMKPLEAMVDGRALKADRKLHIIAIPNGRELPSKKGLLVAARAMNQAELAKAEALGLTPKEGEPVKPGQFPREHFSTLWFGKDNVILPNSKKGGSLLTPKEISLLLTDRAPGSEAHPLGLFESTDISRKIGRLPPKTKNLIEVMVAPDMVSGIWVDADPKPLVDLVNAVGPDKIEAILARGEISSQNLSRLLDKAANVNFPADAAVIREFLHKASVEEILFLTDSQSLFIDRLANVKVTIDGRKVGAFELLNMDDPYPYLVLFQDQMVFPGLSDRLLGALALREFHRPTHSAAGLEFLAMFGIDPQIHDHFPWNVQDTLSRAALYVEVAKQKAGLIRDYQKAFPNVDKAEIETFINDLWKTLRTQDVKDTKLPYTPHGWKHSLTVMADSARIFGQAGPVREAIVAKLRPKYGDRAELAARELVKFIGIFHDTGYGCLHQDHEKSKHAEFSGDLFRTEFAGHMEKVFGIKADDPLFNEVFLAIERHGSDKPGKAEYMRASDTENPFLFVIRLADNLDLTNQRMRQIQLNQPLMMGLKEMYLRGQEADFQALGKDAKKREMDAIRAKHAKVFDQAVKDGRMTKVEADRNKKLLDQLNESTYPHFAGTEKIVGYNLIQDPATGQLTVEIHIDGWAAGQKVAEAGYLVDHPLYQILRTYIAAKSMTYGVGPDGAGLPIKLSYRETFRGMDNWGIELSYAPDNVHDFKPERPGDTHPPPAPKSPPPPVEAPNPPVTADAKAADLGGETVNQLHSQVDYLANTNTPFAEMAKQYQERLSGLAKDSAEYKKALTEFQTERDRIATDLVQEHSPTLAKAEDSFLNYLQSLTGSQETWNKIHEKYEFLDRPNGMEILPPHGRLKAPADVVPKLMRRGWKSMEPFTDLAATRVVVDSYTDVHSVVAAIIDKYPVRLVRDANGEILKNDKGQPIRDWNRINRLVAGDKQWGYRAIHLAVEYTLPNGKKVPVEVQIMTRGNYEWGEIQHDLSYKNSSLPKEVKDAANDYFVEVANYLAYLDQGVSHPERPQIPDMSQVPHYDTLSADSKKEIQKSFDGMAELMDRQERIAAQKDGLAVEEKPPPLPEAPKPLFVVGAKATPASSRAKIKSRPEEEGLLAAAVGGRAPVGDLSAPVAGPRDAGSWSGVASALASQVIPLRDIPAGVTELPLYVGSLDGMSGRSGPALVVQDGVQRSETQLWGMLKREGESWVYYPADPGAETVKDAGYAVKPLRSDGYVGVGEGDRLSLGFADFQYRDGHLVLSDDLGTLNVELSLRLPEGAAGRGGVDPRDSGVWGGGASLDLQPPPKPETPGRELTDFSEKMNRRRAALLEKLAGLGEVQGSAKKFSAAEIEELAWLVAERGMDPQKLPRQAREALDEYMVAFVAEFGRLYPAELERKINPFTGEALQRPNPKRPGALIPAYDAQYRYLRSLANRDLGKPLFGEPSPREREVLVNFVSRGMGLKVADYAEAQKVLREEILARTPRAEQALRAADPNLKYYALLSLRGDQAYLPLADGAQGLNLVRFLGKIGFDQEVGVTVVMNGDAPEYRFLIGGWDHVLLQKSGERFLIHSHTKYFLNPKSQVMNKGDVTLASEAGKEHRMSAAVLFSMADLAGMAGEALQAAREGKAVPLLYDPGTRVFRNYVQHPYGMSEAQLHVDASGKVDGIVIRYAFDDKAGLNHDRLPGHKQELIDFLKKYLPDAKVQIQEVSMSELERNLPSP